MGIPPVYDDAAFHLESLLRQFFAGTYSCATSEASVSSAEVSAADVYQAPQATAEGVHTPPAPAPAPSLGQTAARPATAAFRVAKWSFKRLLGGKARNEAKVRLLAAQTELLQLGQAAQEVRQVHSTVLASYQNARHECDQLHTVASVALMTRNRIVDSMQCMDRFDARHLENFRRADHEYRRLYPQVLHAQQTVLEHRRQVRSYLDDMATIQAQARPLLDAYGEDQGVYLRQYGRLPRGVTPAERVRAFFAPLPPMALQDPLRFSMPPPDSLRQPPTLFGGPRPAPHPQPQPRPQPQPGAQRTHTTHAPPPPPPVSTPQQDVAVGLETAKRLEASLGKIYGGDTQAWDGISQGDLDVLQTALSQSSLRRGSLDAGSVRSQKVIAAIVLGNPGDKTVRQGYKRCQMTVHPDKTATLPAAARAKADALCKLLSAAVDVMTA